MHSDAALIGSYDYRLVIVSVAIAIFASYAALDLAGRTTAARGSGRLAWLVGGATAMGVGIWSMHYIGMLAFSLPVVVLYDWPTVLLSLLAAVFAAAVALFVVSRQKMGWFRALTGSSIMGSGIATMHYTGMAAMRLPATCSYDPALLTLSVVLAIGISLVALWLSFRLREDAKTPGGWKIASAVVMGAAIPAMHYTGMAAARFTASTAAPDTSHAVSTSSLGVAGVSAVTLLVLSVAVLTSTLDRRTEEMLRQGEERFRRLVEGIRDYAIFMLTTDGRVASWNLGAERIKGYRAEEILGQHFSCFYPQDDIRAGKPEQELRTARSQGKVEDESWRVRKDGSMFWANVVITALWDGAGRLQGFSKLTRDITERKKAEDRLQASEERFRNLAESASDAIISADSNGNIVYFNPAAERMFQHSASEAVGRPLTILMPEKYRTDHLQGFDRYRRTREAHVLGKTVELMGKRKDGSEFPIELSLSSWENREGMFFTAILSDITERKLVRDQIQELNKELERRNTELIAVNKELESFSYSVSHDLRAPLRAIDGFSLALLEDCQDKLVPQEREHLQRVRSAAVRMGQLIDDMLTLARTARCEIVQQRVDLSGLGQEIVSQLQKSEPKRQASFLIASGLTAEGDLGLLRVVLENLLGNAWKFTSRQSHAVVELGMQVQGNQQVYFVRDNGAGFNMRYSDKLFGAFQRLHDGREFPGTGVGLATVQRIIHRHGGRVWAKGAEGQGATFYFVLQPNGNGNGSLEAHHEAHEG
jgi:PAS domain S-box-containing protein